jgi:hypothetical protein
MRSIKSSHFSCIYTLKNYYPKICTLCSSLHKIQTNMTNTTVTIASLYTVHFSLLQHFASATSNAILITGTGNDKRQTIINKCTNSIMNSGSAIMTIGQEVTIKKSLSKNKMSRKQYVARCIAM